MRHLKNLQKGDVVGQYVQCEMPAMDELAVAPNTAPMVPTPLCNWTGPSEHVRYACSFCRHTINQNEPYNVNFNRILTIPFVVTCAACATRKC